MGKSNYVKGARKRLHKAQNREADAEVGYKYRVRSVFTDATDAVGRAIERRQLRRERQQAEREFLSAVNKTKGRR